jgi:hypothetical protein
MAVVVVTLVACGAPGGPDAGASDAGPLDAGPVCEGVYPGLQGAFCIELDSVACQPSALQTFTANCDAGMPQAWSCGTLEAVSYTSGPFGDAHRCFYPTDGGVLVGAINFSDRGPLVAGSIADCTPRTAPSCP